MKPGDNTQVGCSPLPVSNRGEDVFQQQIEASVRCLQDVRQLGPEVDEAAQVMTNALQAGGRIFACGNGGSAADACHFTTELLCRLKEDRDPLAAFSLTADSSFLTAAANDYGYEHVFARQVQGLARAGDVLVAISTSGQSPSIIHALETARSHDVRTVSLLGREGGACAGLAEVDIIVPNESTARIQEAHTLIIHTLCLLIEHELFDIPTQL